MGNYGKCLWEMPMGNASTEEYGHQRSENSSIEECRNKALGNSSTEDPRELKVMK